MSVRSALAMSFAAVCGAAFAQQTPRFRSETRTVLVEAVVTSKKGDFPRDLTIKDFRLWQDGKEQAITSLSFAPESRSPRFLVFFFDDGRINAPDKASALRDVSRFIDASSAPDHQMAVVSFDGALQVVQGFTDDAGILKDALKRSGPGGGPSNTVQGTTPATGNAFSSRNMLQALQNLSRSLSVLPGRKTIVFLTSGLPFTNDLKSSADAVVEESIKSDVVIYGVNVQPAVGGDNVSHVVHTGPDEMVGRPQAPRGLQGPDDPTPAPQNVDSSVPLLFSLANRSGGYVISSLDDLLPQLQRIGEEQTEHYVLSYTPPESKEGSCHPLRVKVYRSGVNVRARSSYCAVKPLDLITQASGAEDLEKRAVGSDSGNLKAELALPYVYVSAGVARVHLALELSPAGLKFKKLNGKLHLEINLLGIASGADSVVAARFSDVLKFDFDELADVEKFQKSPIHYEKELKIAPGTYTFLLACSSGPEDLGKIDESLVIDPWDSGDLALSSIVLSRQTRPAADLGSIAALIQEQTPLIAQGRQFVPSGSTEFSQNGDGYFYFELYSRDPSSVTVRVRVLNEASGEPQWDSGATKLPGPEGSRKSSVSAAASLPLRSLKAGLYRVEITASDVSGKQVQRTSHFEVD